MVDSDSGFQASSWKLVQASSLFKACGCFLTFICSFIQHFPYRLNGSIHLVHQPFPWLCLSVSRWLTSVDHVTKLSCLWAARWVRILGGKRWELKDESREGQQENSKTEGCPASEPIGKHPGSSVPMGSYGQHLACLQNKLYEKTGTRSRQVSESGGLTSCDAIMSWSALKGHQKPTASISEPCLLLCKPFGNFRSALVRVFSPKKLASHFGLLPTP